MGKDSLGGKLGFGQFLSMKTFRVSFWQLVFVLQIVERNYFSASFCVLFSHDIVSSGELFDHLVGVGSHILGPPAIRGLRARGEPLLVKRSPVFCLQVLLFTLQDNSLVLISI